MKNKIILFVTVIVIAITLNADNYEKLQVLKKDKKDLVIKMHRKRIEIIKKSPSLQLLQKKIIALHKELAIRVDNNEAMRELLSKLLDIETNIQRIEGE